MSTVGRWTGHEARALRLALRLSVRAFAERLGIAARTVSKWEKGGKNTTPWPDSQAILDTTLAQSTDDAKARFALLVNGQLSVDAPTVPAVDNSLRASLDSLNGHTQEYWRERVVDLELWADDLDRVVICLSRQDFGLAGRLLDGWLTRIDPRRLDDRGLYLRARSLAFLGDMRRDQGTLVGPLSATKSYQEAFTGYTQLHIPRRMAQVELSLTVVTEMSGILEGSARGYENLASDARLNARDRARARLWVGTALSKNQEHEAAVVASLDAIQLFEQLDDPETWSGAHQKLALAYLNAGDLHNAVQCIEVPLTNRSRDSPLQQVRLDTAHAHILLSDRQTRTEGVAILNRAKAQATDYGLNHQLQSITRIERMLER